jgi:hypothetical protein
MRKHGSTKALGNADQLMDRLSQNNVSVGRKYLGPILIVLCVFVLSFLLMESNNLYQPSTNTGFRNTSNRICVQTCESLRTERLELFAGRDLLNRNDVKQQILDAKDRLIVKLENDYGNEYFSKIFKNEDGSFRPFVPISDESMKRLKRKLLIKILSVQTALKQKENQLSGGCDCFAETNSDAITMRNLETPSIIDYNDHRIETIHAKYVWATGGHSAAASHGNLYNESYTAYLESDMKDVFQSIGINFEGRNYAMGGTESAAEMAMCWQEIFGDDGKTSYDIISCHFLSRLSLTLSFLVYNIYS